LYFTSLDDEAYFVNLERAKVWTESRVIDAHRKKHVNEAAEGVVAETAKTE
jgi:phosphoglycerate dehydrogenase-like enzyme